MRAVEDLSPSASATRSRADEVAADQERLGDPFGPRLRGIDDPDADLGAVAKQPLEAVLFVRGRDDEDVANPRQHQRRQRVVHHRLAVHRHQLLADGARQRLQPRVRRRQRG